MPYYLNLYWTENGQLSEVKALLCGSFKCLYLGLHRQSESRGQASCYQIPVVIYNID